MTEFYIDDYLQSTDKKPGYSGSLNLADTENIFGEPNADYSYAFGRIMAQLVAGYTNAGFPLNPARIIFTGRSCYHFYSTLVVNHPVELVGIGIPNRSGSNRLVFHDCSGIHVRRFPTGAASFHLGMARVEGVSVEYAGSNLEENEYHGIIVDRTSSITRVLVKGFPAHGIHVEGDVHDDSIDSANSSLSNFSESVIMQCGKSGFWISGKDAQVCMISAVNSFSNGYRHIAEDGFGFYDASMLGNTYTACHTRNNYKSGYRATKYQGVAPNRSMYVNCYSEHSPEPVDSAMQEGVALLDNNALVITSMGDGSLVDAKGGASVITTTLGRIQFRDVAEVQGNNGITATTGSGTEIADNTLASRQVSQIESHAYSTPERIYITHDSQQNTRSWSAKGNSPAGVNSVGITDSKHLRPNLPIAPKGILLGSALNKTVSENGVADGARRISYYDPRNETTLAGAFPNPLPGDRVFNSLPNSTIYDFDGWVYASDSANVKRWFRYNEGFLGTAI